MTGDNHFREEEWNERKDHERKHSIMKEPRGAYSQRLKHFCKRDTMYICLACTNRDRQRNCHFHIPSTGGNHCMELRFDEFCSNHVLHQYVDGRMSDQRAKSLVVGKKKKIADINNRVEGYHIDFPLEGEETIEDLQNIYDQLCQLGMTRPEFWIDNTGKSAVDYETFYVTVQSIKDGTWYPKRKELTKDVLRYLEIRERLGV